MRRLPEWGETEKRRWMDGARSLHPNEQLMNEYVEGMPEARAIIEAWNPRRGYIGLIRSQAPVVRAEHRTCGRVVYMGATGLFALNELEHIAKKEAA